MRLHQLSLVGVGPFRDPQSIDFDELSASRLFLIQGPTGSGKTTIIDAIAYALYGTISSSGDSTVIGDRIRSHFCSDNDPTGVTCEFSVEGRRFRVHRVPSGARDPRQPSRAASAQPRQVLDELNPDGTVGSTLTRRNEVNARITGILGLSSEQFRQLVVLPQGQFQELLVRTPADRLRALESLLADGTIDRLQQALIERGRQAGHEREEAAAAIRDGIHLLSGALLDVLPAPVTSDSPSTGRAWAEQAEGVLAKVTAHLAEIRQDLAEAEKQAARLAGESTSAQRRLADAHLVQSALARVTLAQTRQQQAMAGLDIADADIDIDQLASRISGLHERMGQLEHLARWEEASPDRERRHEALTAAMADAHRTLAQAEAIRDGVPERRTQASARRLDVQALVARSDEHRRDHERLTVLRGQLIEHQERLALMEAAQEAVDRADRDLARSQQTAEEAARTWQALLERERAEATAVLAQRLTEGEPCPVCGSTTHPAPASARTSDSEDEGAPEDASTSLSLLLSSAQHRADEARASVPAAILHAQRAREDLATLRAQAESMDESLRGHSLDSVDQLLGHSAEAVVAAEQASARITELDEALAEIDRVEAEANHAITRAREDAARAEAERARGEAEARAYREDLARLSPAGRSAGAERSVLRHRVGTLMELQEAALEVDRAQAAVPAGRRSVGIAEAEEELTAAAAHAEEVEIRLGLHRRSAHTMSSTLERAEPLMHSLANAVRRCQDIESVTQTAIDVARLVNADNGRKMQLRSFGLLRRFSNVLTVASVHLQRMSSGKFTFQIDQEAGKGQSGLGISVLNTWSGSSQDPRSLSGGETFYASLALALGLADVVRSEAGGSRLETLFVDEGFGSLDQDTLAEVLDQLGDLRRGARVVGVVSHVSEMREAIPDRIEVLPGPDRTSVIRTG